MTRGRIIKVLAVLLLAGAVLRWAGVLKIPGGLFIIGIGIELLLAWIEAVVLFLLGRRIYRDHRRRHEPFDAFVETLREIEPLPKQAFALMEKELRAWHRVYRSFRLGRSG